MAPSSALIKSTPASWHTIYEDEWEYLPDGSEPVELKTEAEFVDTHLNKCVIDTYLNNAEAMKKHLETQGLENNDFTRYMTLLPNTVIEQLVQFTNEQLVASKFPSTNAWELRKMLALVWVRGLYNYSSDLLWSEELPHIANRKKFHIPTHKRFLQVTRSLRGFSLLGRRGDHDDVWNQRNTTFDRLQTMAHLIMEPTQKLLNRKGGNVTIDDELIPSRSRKDVDKKPLANESGERKVQ